MLWGSLFRGLLCPGLLCALLLGLLCRGIAAWLGAHLGRRPFDPGGARPVPPVWQPFADIVQLAGKALPEGEQRRLAVAAWPGLLGLVALSWATGMLPWPKLALPAQPTLPGAMGLYLLLLAVPPLTRLLAAGLSDRPTASLGAYRWSSLEVARILPLWPAAAALALSTRSLDLPPEPATTLWQTLLALAVAGISLATLPWLLWDRDTHDAPLAALGGRPLALFRALEAVELGAHMGLTAIALEASALLPVAWGAPSVAVLSTLVVLALFERAGRHLLTDIVVRRYTRWLLPLATLLAGLGWWLGH